MEKGYGTDLRTPMFSVDQNAAMWTFTFKTTISGMSNMAPMPRKLIYDPFIEFVKDMLKEYPQLWAYEQSFIPYLSSSRSTQRPWKDIKSSLLESFECQKFKMKALA